MCSLKEWIQVRNQLHFFPRKTKRTRVRVLKLSRRKLREEQVGKDILEVKNLKLYIENMSILEENEKLRKKAYLLHQEKLALMSELQKRFSKVSNLGP